jgi:hypothetical protein
LQGVTDTLATIAGRELSGKPLSPGENSFMKANLFRDGYLKGVADGWYPKLLLGSSLLLAQWKIRVTIDYPSLSLCRD